MVWQKSGLILICVCLCVLLAACGAAGDAPETVVQQYLQARVDGDVTTIQQVSCGAWEANALQQAQSFAAMNAQLQGVTCMASQQGDGAVVTCSGEIVTSYNGENRTWPIPAYSLVQEGGAWRVCGEAQGN
jgi:hypothetical protein